MLSSDADLGRLTVDRLMGCVRNCFVLLFSSSFSPVLLWYGSAASLVHVRPIFPLPFPNLELSSPLFPRFNKNRYCGPNITADELDITLSTLGYGMKVRAGSFDESAPENASTRSLSLLSPLPLPLPPFLFSISLSISLSLALSLSRSLLPLLSHSCGRVVFGL